MAAKLVAAVKNECGISAKDSCHKDDDEKWMTTHTKKEISPISLMIMETYKNRKRILGETITTKLEPAPCGILPNLR